MSAPVVVMMIVVACFAGALMGTALSTAGERLANWVASLFPLKMIAEIEGQRVESWGRLLAPRSPTGALDETIRRRAQVERTQQHQDGSGSVQEQDG